MRSAPIDDHLVENGPVSSQVDDGGSALFGLNFSHLIYLVRRNILWLVGIIGLFVALAIVLTLLTTPKYIATSKVLVDQSSEQIIKNTDLSDSSNQGDVDSFIQTQLDIILSRSLAQRVVDKLKLADDDDFFVAAGESLPDPSELSGIYANADGLKRYRADTASQILVDNVQASLNGDSRVITINFQSSRAGYAAKIANGYAESYIEQNLDRKLNSSSYARNFLSTQLEAARAKVEASEEELNRYSEVAGLIRTSGASSSSSTPDSALSITNDRLVAMNNGASQATADRIAAEDAWEAIAKEKVLNVPQVLANPAVQGLIKSKADAQARLAVERSRHLPDHPSVLALVAEIKELDARTEAIGNAIKHSIYLNYVAARDKEESLQKQVGDMRDQALGEQARSVQYNILKRVADTNRALYDTLLQRFSELSAAAGIQSNNISLVDRAEIPDMPSSPKLILNLLIGFVVGAVVAMVFLILRDYFDDAIRSPEDVETKLSLPLFGLIPNVAEVEAESKNVMSPFGEAYQALVANLVYSTSTGLPKVVAITSAKQSEGKTLTSYMVALSLAKLGKSVLLIDADLRRSTLHRRVADPNSPGLADVLAGVRTFEEALIPSDVPNLTFMTALPIRPEPSFLLGGPRLPAIIAQARQNFDVVVLDCPPLLGLADAAQLVTQSDGVLMVIDSSAFHRGAVKSSLRRLNLVRANVLGAVLTKFDPSNSSGNDYYQYSYYQYGGFSEES